MASSMQAASLRGPACRAARAAIHRSFTTSSRQCASTTLRESEQEKIPAAIDLTEMSSMAHAELETHRELRRMARTAAWEMPLLTALAKAFEPPTAKVPLRWRYTTYFGELHPAAGKVTVEFGIADLGLTAPQQDTLRKLAGPRRDPTTDMIKMSCESFPQQAQNKRYLGETIANLIKEAVHGKDKFADIPIDDRHAVKRNRRKNRMYPVARFPKEWYLTAERRAYLDSKHRPQPAQLEAPVASEADENAAMEAIKQAAVEAGEMSAEQAAAIPVTIRAAPAQSAPRVISGLAAIQADNERKTEMAKAKGTKATPPPTTNQARRSR